MKFRAFSFALFLFSLLCPSGSPAQDIQLVQEIRPGFLGSIGPETEFFQVGDIGFFTANDGTNGIELWRTDGTTAGTFILGDLTPSHFSDGNTAIVSWRKGKFGDLFLFSFHAEDIGTELWRSDGTAGGTFLLKDIKTGMVGGNPRSSSPEHFTEFGGFTYFRVSADSPNPPPGTPNETAQLWRTNGTAGGTVPIYNSFVDIGSAIDNSSSDRFATTTSFIFFGNRDSTVLESPWRSDGTDAGTDIITEIIPGGGSNPGFFHDMDGSFVVFNATSPGGKRELWRTNGVAISTFQLSSGTNEFGTNPREPTLAGGKIFFRPSNSRETNGMELWLSNGGELDAIEVKDIWPGIDGTGFPNSSTPSEITAIGEIVYFSANDGQSGRELWRSDGTESGTRRVKDIRPGQVGSNPTSLIEIDGFLYFVAMDPDTLRESVWRSDGTEEGTFVALTAPEDFRAMKIQRLNTKLLVVGRVSGTGDELFAADLTQLVPREPTGPAPPDGSRVIAEISIVLQWNPVEFAETYDIFFWPIDQSKPLAPNASGFTNPNFNVDLELGKSYLWQVVARNAVGDTAGPEWFFTNEKASTAISNHLLGINPIPQDELDLLDTNGDGDIDVADVINWVNAES